MEKIKLTANKLLEILNETDNSERMEFYYNAAVNDLFVADQHMALAGLLLIFVRHYYTKLFVNKVVNPFDFFGLKEFSEDKKLNSNSEHLKFHELLQKTNLEIANCIINGEEIPEKPLIEFKEIQAYTYFCYGKYLECLECCNNALYRDTTNALCNFLKASIMDICYINKTSIVYKIALANYQKELIEKCDPLHLGIDSRIYEQVLEEIDEKISSFGEAEKQVNFSSVFNEFEKTQENISEWTEEHEFYLRHNLFLNPLSNFDKFTECSFEEIENLNVEADLWNLFLEIVDDYKLTRNITFLYCKGDKGVGKREMAMAYSYAYSIFDKIAFLLKKAYDLNIDEDYVGFTKKTLFDVKTGETGMSFGDIKNINIVPLYFIMKQVREKNNSNVKNALNVGTWEHNELRNMIDHKSLSLVEEDKLKRNTKILLEYARNAILYTYMLLHSCYPKTDYCKPTAISTAFFRAIIKISENTTPGSNE